MPIHRHVTACFAVALLAPVTACQPAGEQQATEGEAGRTAEAVDTAAVMAAIDSVRSAFAEAYTAGEFSRVSPYIHSDVIYSPPGHPPIRGPDSVIAHDWRTIPPGATFELEPVDTRVVDGEWAFELGTSTVTFTARGGDEETSMRSSYLVVLRNTGDGWQLYREVGGSDRPPGGGS